MLQNIIDFKMWFVNESLLHCELINMPSFDTRAYICRKKINLFTTPYILKSIDSSRQVDIAKVLLAWSSADRNYIEYQLTTDKACRSLYYYYYYYYCILTTTVLTTVDLSISMAVHWIGKSCYFIWKSSHIY